MESTPRQLARNTRAAWEATAVLVTGILHLLPLEHYFPHVFFIVIVMLGWGSYAVYRLRKDRSCAREWGFRMTGFRPTARICLRVLFFGVVGMAIAGIIRRHNPINPNMLPLFVFYPLWGLAQQFLVLALVIGNLRRLIPDIPEVIVASLGAVLFGMVHAPDWELTLATCLLGAIFTPVYLRYRNLWPLGLTHGWLGVFMYYWVQNKDPLQQIFQVL